MSFLTLQDSGIYGIFNRLTGQAYIGSTKNFKYRWVDHRARLRKGSHPNPKLQKDWNDLGELNFYFLALEIVDDLNLLITKEQFWCDSFKVKNILLYNCGLFVDNPTKGTKFTEEHKAKLSAKKKGVKTGRQTLKTQTYYLTDPLGNQYVTENFAQFCREHRLTKSWARDMIDGNRPDYKGWTGYKRAIVK